MKKIHDIIEDQISTYEDTTPNNYPSFCPKQEQLIDLIDSYWVSKFRDGDSDILGFKKVFYNIVNFPVETNAKMLDLDTKDINLVAEDWASYWPAWLMSKELKMWMKDKYFGRQLNEYALNLPKYGHIFVKKVNDDVVSVPPQNIIVNPAATNIKNIPVIEKHEYTEDEFQYEANAHGWKNTENIKPNNDGLVVVYEAYFPNDYTENYVNKYLEGNKNNYFIIAENSEKTLFETKKSESPYKELAWERLAGRFFGRGQVEKLFEEQIYLNRIVNYEAQGLHWTSKHIYQTRNTSIGSNLMTEVNDGDIVITNDELTPIAVEERNLAFYQDAKTRWENNANRRAFAQEPITGERAPSGTPLGSTIIQTRMTMSFFEQKKEELGMFIKEILWDWILPQFKSQTRKEHKVLMKSLLEGDEDNSEKFFQLKLNERMNKLRMSTNKHLSPDQWAIRKGLQAEILKNGELEVPKGFYDDLKYKIDIIITGEQVDTAAKMTTLQTMFQMLGSNPTILKDKRIRKIFYKMVDLAGFNPKDLQLEEEPTGLEQMVGEAQAQRGGSIAAIKTPALQPTAMQTNLAV